MLPPGAGHRHEQEGVEVGTTDEPEPTMPEAADPSPEPHDPTGLGLAQTLARSLGNGRRGAPGRRSTRGRGWTPRPVGPGPQVSGSHPDERDPQLLSTAMERLVDSKGWTAQVDVRSMLARWSTLVGPVNAAHSHPESYADAVLTVRADSTAWATQLRLLAPRLVATLNTALGDGTVTRVTVLGPDAPSWKRGRLSVRDGRGPRDTYG
jgi:predicted nucleic acid-binding Zn ribbon protein